MSSHGVWEESTGEGTWIPKKLDNLGLLCVTELALRLLLSGGTAAVFAGNLRPIACMMLRGSSLGAAAAGGAAGAGVFVAEPDARRDPPLRPLVTTSPALFPFCERKVAADRGATGVRSAMAVVAAAEVVSGGEPRMDGLECCSLLGHVWVAATVAAARLSIAIILLPPVAAVAEVAEAADSAASTGTGRRGRNASSSGLRGAPAIAKEAAYDDSTASS